MVKDIQESIKAKVPTSLILGAYDESKAGNEKYPGISQYIQRTQLNLNKQDIYNIVSVDAVMKEMVKAVGSAQLFNTDMKYDDVLAMKN